MNKQNKNMDWLKDFNKDAEEFNNSEWGQLTQKEIDLKVSNTHAASCVSQETRSKAGKIGGQKNVESGHWASLRTPEHQSHAGTISGNKHIESGHIINLGKSGLGAKATSEKYNKQRFDRVQQVANLMEPNKAYGRKDLEALIKTLELPVSSVTRVILKDEFPELIRKVKGAKKTLPSKYYKK